MKWTEDRLRTKFSEKVREERKAEGLDPDVCPTQDWLRSHGYSGIEGWCRRNDMTLTEALQDICGFDPRPQKPLNVNHAKSRRLLEEWFEKEQNLFHNWGDTRVADARTHIRTLAEIAYEEFGSTNLLRVVDDSTQEPQLLTDLFTGLSRRLESQGAQSNYTRSLERWAEYLITMNVIEDHKVGKMRNLMSYTYERRSPEHNLEPEQIRRCWEACEDDLQYKALLIMLTTAGIRRAEPTDIKVNQLRLDREDPYIVFDEDRKTGVATVPIMAGVNVIEAWIDELKNQEWWDGEWLFPSKKSEDGSRPPGWVNNVIDELMKSADVQFPDGKVPTPKDFRSFWYSRYMGARQAWLNELDRVAEEQGVESGEIINTHYLNDEPERDHFRRFAESYFSAVFGEHLTHGFNAITELRREERDEPTQKAIDDYMGDVTDTITEDQENNHEDVHKSPIIMEPISRWMRTRLSVEHKAACASNNLEHYPPPPSRAGGLGLLLVAWAALFGTLWGLTGVFYYNPLSGNLTVSPSVSIGILVGFILILFDLPKFEAPNLSLSNR